MRKNSFLLQEANDLGGPPSRLEGNRTRHTGQWSKVTHAQAPVGTQVEEPPRGRESVHKVFSTQNQGRGRGEGTVRPAGAMYTR